MKKIVYIFLIFINSLFAFESSAFQENDIYTGSFNINGECKATCRTLKGGYKGIVMDFNPFSGATKCNIIELGVFEDTSSDFVADTINQTCINQTSQKVNENTLVSYGKRFDNNVTLTYKKQDTLSKLLVGTVTLDDDIINIPATVNSNNLVLRSGQAILENNFFQSLSSGNLGFFVNLIYGLQKVYAYVQYFMFIFIGAFFLIIYIWEIAVNKIGKTGEKEKMNKFVVPLVMILLCFVPIPKQGGITTTPIQSILQYFMQHSNQLADRVSLIGSEAYIKKLYTLLGTNKVYEEKELAERVLNLQSAIGAYTKTYTECKKRFEVHYKQYKNFQSKDENIIKNAEDKQTKGAQHYSFAGCKKIEADLINAERELKEKETTLEAIRNVLNGEISNILSKLKIELEKKNNAYGWIYTGFMISNAVVVENISDISSGVNKNQVRERNVDLDTEYNSQSSNDYLDGIEDGGFLGQLAYFMLPGAYGVYNAIFETERGISKSLKMSSKAAQAFSKLPVLGAVAAAGAQALQTSMRVAAVTLTTKIYSTILQYLPMVIGIVAGLIAISVYLIELFKYFYLSPFVVLYSVTKRSQNKIIEFFINGIVLFLKPLLITICIFLSLIIYYLFLEFFMGLVMFNFDFLDTLQSGWKGAFGFSNALITATFTTLFYIIIHIVTAYLMYQIIINGSKMFLTLAGLQDKDSLSSSLSQRMDKYSMQV